MIRLHAKKEFSTTAAPAMVCMVRMQVNVLKEFRNEGGNNRNTVNNSLDSSVPNIFSDKRRIELLPENALFHEDRSQII